MAHWLQTTQTQTQKHDPLSMYCQLKGQWKHEKSQTALQTNVLSAQTDAVMDTATAQVSVAVARLAASRLLQPRLFPRSGWLNPNCLE